MDGVRILLLPVVALCLATSQVGAEVPRVHFDMPYAIGCADVTPPEFALANPSHRLVEANFEISSLLLDGDERDLAQYFLRIDSPKRTMLVADYLPKTLHESRHAGPITHTDSKERSASLGVNFAGKYEFITGVGANAGIGTKNTSCVKFDLLPPLETVAASGTLLRGAGVYFKLKASPRRRLEGASQFALVLRVPLDWRSDYVRVHCEAQGVQKGFVSSLDENVRCGERDFLVALYLEGDEAARLQAERLAQQDAQTRLSQTARKPGSKSGLDSNWLSKLNLGAR
jgi:hypothetical protein